LADKSLLNENPFVDLLGLKFRGAIVTRVPKRSLIQRFVSPRWTLRASATNLLPLQRSFGSRRKTNALVARKDVTSAALLQIEAVNASYLFSGCITRSPRVAMANIKNEILPCGWRTTERNIALRFRFALGYDEFLLRGPRFITRVIRRTKCPFRVALL